MTRSGAGTAATGNRSFTALDPLADLVGLLLGQRAVLDRLVEPAFVLGLVGLLDVLDADPQLVGELLQANDDEARSKLTEQLVALAPEPAVAPVVKTLPRLAPKMNVPGRLGSVVTQWLPLGVEICSQLAPASTERARCLLTKHCTSMCGRRITTARLSTP